MNELLLLNDLKRVKSIIHTYIRSIFRSTPRMYNWVLNRSRFFLQLFCFVLVLFVPIRSHSFELKIEEQNKRNEMKRNK